MVIFVWSICFRNLRFTYFAARDGGGCVRIRTNVERAERTEFRVHRQLIIGLMIYDNRSHETTSGDGSPCFAVFLQRMLYKREREKNTTDHTIYNYQCTLLQ